MDHIVSDWIRLDLIWLDSIRLDQIQSIGSDLIRFDQIWSDLIRFNHIGSDWIKMINLAQTCSNWKKLDQIRSNWIVMILVYFSFGWCDTLCVDTVQLFKLNHTCLQLRPRFSWLHLKSKFIKLSRSVSSSLKFSLLELIASSGCGQIGDGLVIVFFFFGICSGNTIVE